MKELLIKTFITILAILAPIKAVMISVGILIVMDLITGIWAAIKKGQKIESSVMRRTISKMCIYQIAVICGFLLETFLIGGIFPVSNLVAGVIGMVEFKSILENSNIIVGGDVFKIILKKLGSDNDKRG